MKKLIVLIVLVLSFAVLAVSCADNQTAGTSGNNTQNSQNTDTGATESSGNGGQTTDSSTVDSSTTDSSTTDSSTVGSSTADNGTADSTTGSSTQQGGGDESEPEIEIVDSSITLATDGVTDYVIVYETRDVRVQEFAFKLVDIFKTTYGISITAVNDKKGTSSEHVIYVGDIKNATVNRVKDKMNAANDFGACVSGDDYVLYATNSRLYEYLYDVMASDLLKTIAEENWNITPADNFTYHSSKYSETSYVDYVVEKKGGALNMETLLTFFEDRTHYAVDNTTMKYRLYVPYDYDKTKEYPVLTILHGAGERGNNNTSQMQDWILKLFKIENSPLWNSIVICPQCPGWPNQWVDTPWAEGDYSIDEVPQSNEITAVLEILDTLEYYFPTDKNRYYVTGLSMGGFGTWDLITRYPDRFAAAVPMCGGGDPSQAYKLVDVPIYTVHDKNDTTVPASGTRVVVEAIEALGGTKIIYEEITGYGHLAWNYASAKPEIWLWLFQQSLEDR